MKLKLFKDKQRLLIQTDCWSIAHDLKRGGCICEITFLYGTAENILASPITSAFGPFSETWDGSPKFVVEQDSAGAIILRLEGRLLRKDGSYGGIDFIHIYEYTENYLRQKQIFSCPKPVKWDYAPIALFSTDLRPDLDTYGIRYSYRHKLFDTVQSWEKQFVVNGVKWGKILPGVSPLLDHHVPDYLCFLHEGMEGIEWFPNSQGPQWETQFAGKDGVSRVEACVKHDPARISVTVEPYFDWMKVKSLVLKGSYFFGSYIGLPKIRKKMIRQYWFGQFNNHPWPSDQKIRELADSGVNLYKIHNDYYKGENFWHDGTYPPYDPKGMKELGRVIRTAHRHGMKVIPYFSLVQLHPISNAYKQHANQWKRTVDKKGAIHHDYIGNGEYGAQMCLASGWLDYLKEYIPKVLNNLGFDGVYYDWCYALYCNNRRHGGAEHLAVDELIDMVEWSRKLLGDDGVLITHQSSFPMMAIENMADAVVTLEEIGGDNYFYKEAPHTENLLPHCAFVNATPRFICPGIIGCSPDQQGALRKLIASCLPIGHFPYGLDSLYKTFSGFNLSDYVFLDYRHQLVRTSDQRVKGAVFVGEKDSLVVLSNLSNESIRFHWKIDPETSLIANSPFWVFKTTNLKNKFRSFGMQEKRESLPPYGYTVQKVNFGTEAFQKLKRKK